MPSRPATRSRSNLAISLLMMIVAGCLFTLAPSSAVSADEHRPTPEERVVALLVELATGLSGTADCEKVAATINAWSDTHRDELPRLVRETEARTGALAPDEEARLESQMAPAMEQIFTAAMLCAEHEDTAAAFERLDAIMSGGGDQSPPG